MATRDHGRRPIERCTCNALLPCPGPHGEEASWRDRLFDDGTDPINRACTRIAIVMLGGLLAIYLETFL